MRRTSERTLCVAILLAMAVLTMSSAALAADNSIKVFADLEQLPADIVAEFAACFAEDLATLENVELVHEVFRADVVLIASGVSITADELHIGYSLALTWLGVRGTDEQGVVMFMYPAVNPVVIGVSNADWAAHQAAWELTIYLESLAEMGEVQVVE